MTVAKLIEYLKKFPSDYEVEFFDGSCSLGLGEPFLLFEDDEEVVNIAFYEDEIYHQLSLGFDGIFRYVGSE